MHQSSHRKHDFKQSKFWCFSKSQLKSYRKMFNRFVCILYVIPFKNVSTLWVEFKLQIVMHTFYIIMLISRTGSCFENTRCCWHIISVKFNLDCRLAHTRKSKKLPNIPRASHSGIKHLSNLCVIIAIKWSEKHYEFNTKRKHTNKLISMIK